MPLRMVEIVLGTDAAAYFQEPVGDVEIQGIWRLPLDEGNHLIRILLNSDQAEKLLDLCQERYGSLPEFHCVVLDVKAVLPRPEEEEEPEDESGDAAPAIAEQRISREELYHDVEGAVKVGPNFLALTVLSTIVAAVGLLRDSVAIIIGAMVIAPLLGPNMALALSTLLGDATLARRAIKTILAGAAIALGLSFLLGLLLHVDETSAELIARTKVGVGDIALALCSGAAGALSFTSGLSSALVGVMVAVALLPPLATCGLFLALGNFAPAAGAGLLFLTNLVCVNLSGVAVFRIQGIRPGERDQVLSAERITWLALAFWSGLLALLIWAITRTQSAW